MQYPWPIFELLDEPDITISSLRVYMRLIRMTDERILYEPCPIKASAVARYLELKEHTVGRALSWLIEKEYVIDCGRGLNFVRKLKVRVSTPAPKRQITPAA